MCLDAFGGFLNRLFAKRPGRKPKLGHMGYLHIGSRIPLEDLKKARSGRHSLVDPYFASLSKRDLKMLEKRFPNFEFSSMPAHEFLEEKIRQGVKYATIRIDAPYTGIIDESSDFGLLCKQMAAVLVPRGKIVIVTDYKPDREGIVHKCSENDAVEMYALLKGRELSELSEEEAGKLAENVREEKTANILKELKRAGFKVRYFAASESAIRRSESAARRAESGRKIYMVVASKPY
jgi:hypothetical protein